MSIYTARPRRPVSVPPPLDDGSLLATPAFAPAAAPGASQRSRSQPANYLLLTSLEWLERLSPPVRPAALATQFPRIANRLASGWNEPAAMRRSFDDLVYDRRGSRRGFPVDVHRDLMTLRDYYFGYVPQRSR
jgi:hypothetical protein